MKEDEYGVTSPRCDDVKNLFLAIAYGKVHLISSLLAKCGDSNLRDPQLKTPLIHAIFVGKDDVRSHIVRMLLRYGCDVNAQDCNGRTALMYVCMDTDKVDTVRLLIRCKKCDPNIQDNDGYTGLMHAAASGNTAAIRVLIGHTNTKSILKLNAVSKHGLSALELAVKLRLPEVCKVLVQEGCSDTCVKDRSALLDILRDGSRTNTPFAFSSMNSPRYMFSPRTAQTPFRASPFTRPISDLHKRVLLSPSAEASIPLPGRHQSIYNRLLNSPCNQFPISPREIETPGATTVDIHNKSTSSRRPLTPITPRNSVPNTKSPSPVHNLPLVNRLPSIPSGKRVAVAHKTDFQSKDVL